MSERKIISASESKSGKSKSIKEDTTVKTSSPKGSKQNTAGLRIIAIVLWIIAIALEVVAIYMISINEITIVIIALVLDAVFVIIGSLLWKKANHINPTKSKNKAVQFIWNQMGAIVALIAFIPFGIYLLVKADKVDAKTKKLILVLATALFLGAFGTSIDYSPATASEISNAEAAILAEHPDFDGTVYWTRFGKSFHIDKDCHTLKNSEVLITGTLAEAFEAKRVDPCDFCVGDLDIEVPADNSLDDDVTE